MLGENVFPDFVVGNKWSFYHSLSGVCYHLALCLHQREVMFGMSRQIRSIPSSKLGNPYTAANEKSDDDECAFLWA